MEAERVQERSGYKILHCLIYGRQQRGSKVRFLPFTLCFRNTTVCQSTTLNLNNSRHKRDKVVKKVFEDRDRATERR